MFANTANLLVKKVFALGKKIGELNNDNNRITRNIGFSTLRDLFFCNNVSRQAFFKIVDKCQIQLETFIAGSTLAKRKKYNDTILEYLKAEQEFCLQHLRPAHFISGNKLNDSEMLKLIIS